MLRLLVATNNAHKLRELRAELNLQQLALSTPQEVGIPLEFDVEETGQTFAENAELKARAFAAQSGLASLADDSGLMVTALNGQPGVHSKRWIEGSDHDRNQYLLDKLTQSEDRSAKFVTVLALYLPDTNQTYFFEGEVEGTIAESERGTAGFGYDPLFIPEGHQHTFAELGDEEKAKLSHRHRALEKLRTFLEQKQ